jgi:hypothetical protein
MLGDSERGVWIVETIQDDTKRLVQSLGSLDQPLKLKSISVEMKGMAWQGTRSFLKEVRV